MMLPMAWIIVGLGNPGAEYAGTRHNTGRMTVEHFAGKATSWREDAKANALVTKTEATLVLPNTFMNKSGSAVSKFVKSVKAAGNLVVVYDDLDLPLGKMKISYNRSSGGHKGIESVERAVKTKKFWRLRVGISAATASGKIKKPHGDAEVQKFILGKFRGGEGEALKKVFKKTSEALTKIISDGPERAMNEFN